MEIQKDIISKCKEFPEQEHIKMETVDKLPLKNETDNFIFNEKVKIESLEEEKRNLNELDVFDEISFIKTEKDESLSLCDYKISDNKGGYLTMPVDPKIEPLHNPNSKMPVSFEEEEKYSNLIESNCKSFSSNNLNSSVKELQKCPLKNVDGGFESDELLTDSEIDILKHSFKTESQDFNTFEDNIERGDWDEIGKVNESNCNDKHVSNKRGIVNHDSADKKFKCDKCGYNPINKKSLKMHIQKHSLVRFFCEICNKKFTKKSNMDYHIVFKHSENEKAMSVVTSTIYSCSICTFKTLCNSRFKTHLQKHKDRETNKFQCHKCDYKTTHKYNLKSHIQTHVGPKTYPCPVCNKKFYVKRVLDSHICSKHSNNEKAMLSVSRKVYSCEICRYKTIFKDRIEDHILRKYKCRDAEKNFTTTKTKRIKLQKYSCQLCDYKTFNKTNFNEHNKTHIGKRRYQRRDIVEKKPRKPRVKRKLFCEICNMCFFSKQQLDGHILTLHLENEEIMSSVTSEYYSCDICDFKTVWLENIKTHQQSHSDNINS